MLTKSLSLMFLSILFIPFLTVSTSLADKMYKWTDENGVEHYTNNPGSMPMDQFQTQSEPTIENIIENVKTQGKKGVVTSISDRNADKTDLKEKQKAEEQTESASSKATANSKKTASATKDAKDNKEKKVSKKEPVTASIDKGKTKVKTDKDSKTKDTQDQVNERIKRQLIELEAEETAHVTVIEQRKKELYKDKENNLPERIIEIQQKTIDDLEAKLKEIQDRKKELLK